MFEPDRRVEAPGSPQARQPQRAVWQAFLWWLSCRL